jgi:hypothetical protein
MNYVESGKTARTARRGANLLLLSLQKETLGSMRSKWYLVDQMLGGMYIPFCDALGPRAIVGLIASKILTGRNTINL